MAERPVARMISGSTTERLANTGRRLNAISTTLAPSRMRRPRLGAGVGRGAGWLSTSASISSSLAVVVACEGRLRCVAAPLEGRGIELMGSPAPAC